MRHLVLRRDDAAAGHVGLSGQEDEIEFLLRRQLDRFCGEKHGSEREEENGRNDFFHGVDNPSGCFGNAVSWSKDSMNIPKIKAVPAARPGIRRNRGRGRYNIPGTETGVALRRI